MKIVPLPSPLCALSLVAAALLAACATPPEPQGSLRPETVFALTSGMELLKFNAGQPGRILARVPVTGLAAGDALVGIDFRVSRGVLFTLAQSGRVYTVNTGTGALTPVPAAPLALALPTGAFGFDFNPAVDRMRIVAESGMNLRIHPETGAVVDGNAALAGVQPDTPLTYAETDVNAGKAPSVTAVAYTYNKTNEKITTLYAIDRGLGVLAMQGSREGSTPPVSPDTGRLTTIGALGLGPLVDASFDISDLSNTALAAVRTPQAPKTRLVLVDLATGSSSTLGTVGDGSPLLGMAIEP
jgi:hypothetical protein